MYVSPLCEVSFAGSLLRNSLPTAAGGALRGVRRVRVLLYGRSVLPPKSLVTSCTSVLALRLYFVDPTVPVPVLAPIPGTMCNH